MKFRVIEQYDPTFNTIEVFTSYYAIEKNDKIMKTSSISFELPLGLFIKVENENQTEIMLDQEKAILLSVLLQSYAAHEVFPDLDEE